MVPRLDTRCPKCQVGIGVAHTIATIPGHMHKVAITLTCPDCGHEWTIERTDTLGKK